MTTQKLNGDKYYSLLQLTTLNQTTCGCRLKVTIYLLFFSSAFTAAEKANPQPPPADYVSIRQSFKPKMAIVKVVIISAFFVLGFFSIYIRQCMERRFQRAHGSTAEAAGGNGGGPPGSRRVPVGLDASVIETFPTFLCSAVKGLKTGKGSLECAVCLNEFEEDETLRLIPQCSHVFHPKCIDAWLALHITCPVCRANLVPKPDDLPFGSVQLFEPRDHLEPVEPESYVRDCENQNPVQVCIEGADAQITWNSHSHEMQSLEANLLYSAHQNRSIRSWSTRWRLRGMLFLRSHSTGHSLVQPGENVELFTLRLPEEVRNHIIDTAQLNRTKSSVMFPRVRSSRLGYRSASVGSTRRKNFFNYDQFDHDDRSDHLGCPVAPSFLSEAVSIQSGKGNEFDMVENNQVSTTPPKSHLKSVESLGINHVNLKMDHNQKIQNNEGSSDWLRHACQV